MVDLSGNCLVVNNWGQEKRFDKLCGSQRRSRPYSTASGVHICARVEREMKEGRKS